MNIAGLQKLSLVDLPGGICSSVFLKGCNFKCGYCQNPDLVEAGPGDMETGEVVEYLESRKKMLDGIVITGGEPTIHEDLPEFISRVSLIGLKIKLDTNGSNPAMLEQILQGEKIALLSLDIKTSWEKYHLVSSSEDAFEKVKKSLGICRESGVPYEIRTTCAPGIVDDDDFRCIASDVTGAGRYCLQQFRPFYTYDPAFANITPFPEERIRKFAEILSPHVEKVELSGL